MLELKNIVKDYPVGNQVVHALQGVNVIFPPTEFVSVLGPSGCGKTTLMNIIGGLDKYTSGDLIIDGKSTNDYKDSDWDDYRNKKIGFVFQSYNLIPHLSVLGNVEIALTISGISKTERKTKAKEALDKVGLKDYYNQKPNQLSGGQMQRVAIARALVNEPEILLADEPTGALDSETSIQVMELLKEVSKTKLVIMVTHNPELAMRYSNRVIKMIDGKIIEDNQAIEKALKNIQPKNLLEKKKKSRMSFWTALGLSAKNLVTKKARTIMTSIAGSIGIIGIAVILALSNGMNNYVANLQSDMLSSTPITITTSTIDMSQAINSLGNQNFFVKFPDAKKIFVQKASEDSEVMLKNNITQEYIDYIQNNLNKSTYNDIVFKTGLDLPFYGINPGTSVYSKLTEEDNTSGGFASMMGGSSSAWQVMLKSDFTVSQYDVLAGSFPREKNEIVIVVSDTNQISEETLIALGLRSLNDEANEYDFNDILGKTYKLVQNDLLYEKNGSKYIEKSPVDIDFASSLTVTIKGIIRIKEGAKSGSLSEGIGYLKELYTYLQSTNKNSEIVKFMEENPSVNPFTGVEYVGTFLSSKEELRDKDYRKIGGNDLPNEISIYPTSFETKDQIKEVLNSYNYGKAKEECITYSDTAELLGSSITSILDIVTYVLIAFTAISLVVSCIMIGIITFVSVLERTKEIGILRSIGARKKDITRVFLAETFIIGLISGLLGVISTYIISLPLNLIVDALLGVKEIAVLQISYALLLIFISVLLTVFAGFLPSFKAAKKDPVTALRTE